MTVHIFCIGRVDSNRDIVMRPTYAPDASDAYEIGVMDFDDGKASDPLNYFSDLPSVEMYLIGYREAAGTLAPLQDTIDAADAQEAQDARDDIEFWRHGC